MMFSSDGIKSFFIEKRNQSCFGVNLYDDFIFFQCILNSVCRAAVKPIVGTYNNISFINHITIAGKETSAIIMFGSNHGFICNSQYFISPLLVSPIPRIRLSRKRDCTLEKNVFVFFSKLNNIFRSPSIKSSCRSGNEMIASRFYKFCDDIFQSCAEFNISFIFFTFAKRHLFGAITSKCHNHKYYLNNKKL